MSLSVESSNIASIPFVAMALQTAEQINDAYMRKMNRDYAAHIPNHFTASQSNLSEIQFRESPNKEKRNE